MKKVNIAFLILTLAIYLWIPARAREWNIKPREQAFNILAPGNKYRKKNAALAVLMKKYYAENPNGVNPNRKLLSISGDYGEALRRAVMELQEIWGLKKDGKFGPKSYEKLIYFLSLVYAHEAQRKHYDKLQIKNEDGQSGIAFHFEDKLQLIDYSSYEFVHHRSSKETTYCIYYSKQSSQNNYITLLKDKSHVKAKKEKNAHSGGKWLYVIYLYE